MSEEWDENQNEPQEDWGDEDNEDDHWDEDNEMSDDPVNRENTMTRGVTEENSMLNQVRKDSVCAILDGESISRVLKQRVKSCMEIMQVDADSALILLQHYNQQIEVLKEAWLNDQEALYKECGLALEPKDPEQGRCPVCLRYEEEITDEITDLYAQKLNLIGDNLRTFDDDPSIIDCPQSVLSDKTKMWESLHCGHRVCLLCWVAQLNNTAETDQNTILRKKCPGGIKCPITITDSCWNKFLTHKNMPQYRHQLYKSQVEVQPNVNFCPFPNCDQIAEVNGTKRVFIDCHCGHAWCFGCLEEMHSPVDCDTVSKWKEKNSSESENVKWIIANTKPCPKCRKPIEKNQGCNHMTCSTSSGGCSHEFCWLCMGDWTQHGSSTGGQQRCNKYEDLMKEDSKLKNEEAKRKMAKEAIDKYTHYFERQDNHHKAMHFAIKEKDKIKETMITLHDVKEQPMAELQFLMDAQEQVIRSRRVLKWTYCQGFQLEDEKEKDLFEFLQEKLEENTELLSELTEKDLKPHEDPESPDHDEFFKHKGKLANLTDVTRRFMANLLEGLAAQGGLTDDKMTAKVVTIENTLTN